VKIEAVDFCYLAMPEVTEEFDGSGDALLVRVQAGDHEGWGECEPAPLVYIASFVCPRSHGACRPLRESVLADHDICEYPVNSKPVTAETSRHRLAPGKDGLLHLSEAPGLGIDLGYAAMGRYLVDIDITVAGETLYRTPRCPFERRHAER
jgi:hypothetical protein